MPHCKIYGLQVIATVESEIPMSNLYFLFFRCFPLDLESYISTIGVAFVSNFLGGKSQWCYKHIYFIHTLDFLLVVVPPIFLLCCRFVFGNVYDDTDLDLPLLIFCFSSGRRFPLHSSSFSNEKDLTL